MTDHLSRYFKATKRKRLESMNEYITRKSEAYARACQAYVRVAGHYDNRPTTWRPWRQGQWDRWQDSGQQSSWSWRSDQTRQNQEWQGGWEPEQRNPQPGEQEEEFHSGDEEEHDGSWATGREPSRSGTHTAPDLEDESWRQYGQELLPDYVQGWYLLQDASLDANERNLIQTAVRGQFTLQRVAQELRPQWPEEELRRRDQGGRQAGLWVEDDDDPDSAGPTEEAYHYEELIAAGMNQEGMSLMRDAEENIEQAYAMI